MESTMLNGNGKSIPINPPLTLSPSSNRSRSQSPDATTNTLITNSINHKQNKLRARQTTNKTSMDSTATAIIAQSEASSPNDVETRRKRKQLASKRKKITLLRHPIITLQHFGVILLQWFNDIWQFAIKHKIVVSSALSTIIILVLLSIFHGPHSFIVEHIEAFSLFAIWWIGLGVLSSIGLGTGLHTFVLYLGPHIAQTVLAANECNSIDFATSGPNKFICPDDPAVLTQSPPTFWDVLKKVQLAAFLWGLGTAIGELPPYFVALASHRSGKRVEDLDGPVKGSKKTTMDSMKEWVEFFLAKFGFLAIVVFASVPNPLFDLAGLTCGHFGVPFWTFFGATFLGKAVIKAHLQTCVVIILFNKKHLEDLINFIEWCIPKLEGKVHPFFEAQRHAYHSGSDGLTERSIVGRVWDLFLILMVGWFVKSIIESLVQERLAELDEVKLSPVAGATAEITSFRSKTDNKEVSRSS